MACWQIIWEHHNYFRVVPRENMRQTLALPFHTQVEDHLYAIGVPASLESRACFLGKSVRTAPLAHHPESWLHTWPLSWLLLVSIRIIPPFPTAWIDSSKPLVVLGSVGAVVGTWCHFSNSMTLEFCSSKYPGLPLWTFVQNSASPLVWRLPLSYTDGR